MIALIVLLTVLAGFGAYLLTRRKARSMAAPATVLDSSAEEDSTYRVSYVPPEFQWSGHVSGTLPIKILTYKQYECLEDARYGFRILGLAPSERKLPQPHKTRAHGIKTVASLARHGFLDGDDEVGYVITDHGLNALEVCSVRY
ncbi:MAG: hypothetical protein Q8M51_07445 [Polaromonas sp.]|uniref:hypothetical protein n=1 Tax=Polaromonas sp. TaxID=1869339 RepID=UPI0027300C9A|nr:hypothetical protein [Polaromonas sp.]MDP1740667.1 hypothetical protein [Polaromonas sp.]MDP1954152.1 hypothetical protein [Polaromonas sp.]MDP3355678.1 hypothetical protein [Polaromonas sp.]MDP3750888.1 hypothetical protein [Polaromonas sp.]